LEMGSVCGFEDGKASETEGEMGTMQEEMAA
jgi:hypothetical protein